MSSRGFTLMEIVVTLVLLSILAAFALPATSSWRENAQKKEVAREVVSILRRARSLALQNNQNTTVTIDLSNKQYLLAGAGSAFPKGLKVEARNSGAWKVTGNVSITFRPQGTASDTIFVRINGDDDLVAKVESVATGLARL